MSWTPVTPFVDFDPARGLQASRLNELRSGIILVEGDAAAAITAAVAAEAALRVAADDALDAADDALDARVDLLEPVSYKTALPLDAAWTNVGGIVEVATYSKVGRVVYLQGAVTKGGGTPTAGDVIGTLPAGFRPTDLVYFSVVTGPALTFADGVVRVSNTGALTWRAGTTTETDGTSLSGISFVVP